MTGLYVYSISAFKLLFTSIQPFPFETTLAIWSYSVFLRRYHILIFVNFVSWTAAIKCAYKCWNISPAKTNCLSATWHSVLRLLCMPWLNYNACLGPKTSPRTAHWTRSTPIWLFGATSRRATSIEMFGITSMTHDSERNNAEHITPYKKTRYIVNSSFPVKRHRNFCSPFGILKLSSNDEPFSVRTILFRQVAYQVLVS